MQYVSGPYTSGQLLTNVRAVEDWIANEFRVRGPITDATVERDMANRVLDASQGRNTCMCDDQGNPSMMVRIPAMLLSQLRADWPKELHPAFVVGASVKSEFWIGKYQGATVGAGAAERAISLRRRDPRAYIDFDQARTVCSAKGAGWHLITNAEWALLALWCKANGYWPRGNNSYGVDTSRPTETGEISHTYTSDSTVYNGRVAAGTGPAAWSHDGTPFGVWDLNGNVWEWVGGLRLVDGEIQILPNNNAADGAADQSRASTAWRAILQDGSLVEPGTPDTLKFDSPAPLTNDGTTQNWGTPMLRTALVNPPDQAWNWGDNYYDYNYGVLQSVQAAPGVVVPRLLQVLSLMPIDADHGGDYLYTRNYGERLPGRGGSWNNGADAGVCALTLNGTRATSNHNYGCRPAFIQP